MHVTYITRPSSTGLEFPGVYTYAHSIDNSSGNSNGAGIQNPANLRLYRGNSDFDIRHSAVFSWSYELPFGRSKPFLSGARGALQTAVVDWKLNGITTFQTGSPFTTVM